MAGARRSGRIPKEISILLVGTDVGGRVFSEETKTVLLSRHGAGILSRYKIAPEEILTLRLAGDRREAEIRLVGPMGERPDGCIYGVAFCDPALDFWRIEFSPASPVQNPAAREATAFECSICHARELVQPSDIETDVYAINESILLPCKNCGITTNWTHAQPAALILSPAATLPACPVLQAAGDLSKEPSRVATAMTTATLELLGPESFYTTAPPVTVAAIELREPQHVSAPPPASSTRKENRRQHLRTSVSFTACIRHPDTGEEIVECDDISKSGFSFRSLKRYFPEAIIEAAVPHSPGWTAIFVSAQIKRVQQLPGGALFKYGAVYIKFSPSITHF